VGKLRRYAEALADKREKSPRFKIDQLERLGLITTKIWLWSAWRM
jgi:hypothetical protein